MPFTVITLSRVPPALRGDLSKWMQEIATGVYVGNFNTAIREKLWERVKNNLSGGEATLSYAYRNEIGYNFQTENTRDKVIDSDGIPLIYTPTKADADALPEPQKGFSQAAKFRKANKYRPKKQSPPTYVVLDLETDGLDPRSNTIIEIGAVKQGTNDEETFHALIAYDKALPQKIKQLTGITDELLKEKGQALDEALDDLLAFLGTSDIVGYGIDFDIRFLNDALMGLGKKPLTNKSYDLKRYVKKEQIDLNNYKLQTVLKAYAMDDIVPHRALDDAEIIGRLAKKVNEFLKEKNKKG